MAAWARWPLLTYWICRVTSDPKAPAAAPTFWEIAFSPMVRNRALKIASIVGCVLAAINHGDKILAMDVDLRTLVKIAMTFLVPYAVSTYSAVQAVREKMALAAQTAG